MPRGGAGGAFIVRDMLQQTASAVVAPLRSQVGNDLYIILEKLVTDKNYVKFKHWQQIILDIVKCPYGVKYFALESTTLEPAMQMVR